MEPHAPEIGRPGQFGYELLQFATQKIYKDAPYTGVESVFEVIEADERGTTYLMNSRSRGRIHRIDQ